MSEKTLEKRIQDLKGQQEQAKELFIKCQGAIEVLESMKEEENKEVKKAQSANKKPTIPQNFKR